MVTELRNNGRTEGQGKSNIAPLFQSGAINTNPCFNYMFGVNLWLHLYGHVPLMERLAMPWQRYRHLQR